MQNGTVKSPHLGWRDQRHLGQKWSVFLLCILLPLGTVRAQEACCLPDGSCEDIDPPTCTTSGGLSQGPGSGCGMVSCPQPQVACCFDGGFCVDLALDTCGAISGTSGGIGSACVTASCEDCNENGIPDSADIANATSSDCNINNMPDECDIDNAIVNDCNSNGVIDSCELGSPPDLSVIEGMAGAEYGAALVIQDTQTGFGDNLGGQLDSLGSELDVAYGAIQDGVLYLVLAGNIEANGNNLEIFVDSVPGGQNELRGDNATVDGNGLNRMGDIGGGGLLFDAGFDADYWLAVSGSTNPYNFDVYWAELPTAGGGSGYFVGSNGASIDGILVGGANPEGIRGTIDNSNVLGVGAGFGVSSGAGVATGVELRIPLAALGNPAGPIQVCAFINGASHDFVSNQVLGPIGGGFSLGEPRAIDFASIPGDQFFTVNVNPGAPLPNDCNANLIPDDCENVLYVDDSATNGLKDGSSWTDAFINLQDALTASDSNCAIDQIWVASGVYYPDRNNANPNGSCTPGPCNRTATFQLRNGISLHGGFSGVETALSQRFPDPNPETSDPLTDSVLSGDVDNDGDFIDGDNSYHVVTGSGVTDTENTIVDGFTISGGYAEDVPSGRVGGGIYNVGGSATFRNCAVLFNRSVGSGLGEAVGGGMANLAGSNPAIYDCVFKGNVASSGFGAGMYNEDSNPTCSNCRFVSNSSDSGGGIYNQGSRPLVTECYFLGNGVSGGGAGIHNRLSSPAISNCKFENGSAGGSGINFGGGGIANELGSNPTIASCIFVNNVATHSGGAIYNDNSSPHLINCNFIGNSANTDGGAFYDLAGGFAVLSRCGFYQNYAGDDGGALYLNSVNSKIWQCSFAGNYATDLGGAIATEQATPTVVSSVFAGNVADTQDNTDQGGGAIYNSGSPTVITNCSLSGNRSANEGGGVFNIANSDALISNCIIWANSSSSIFSADGSSVPTVAFSIIQNGIGAGSVDGGGNIDADPLFIEGPQGTWTADATAHGSDQTTLIDANANQGAGFEEDELVGRFLIPNTNGFLQTRITSNGAFSIVVWGDFVTEGVMGNSYRINDYRLSEFSPAIDAGTNGPIGEWLVADGGNGHAYELIGYPNGFWEDARAIARSLGGERESYLATVTTPEENAFILDVINDPDVTEILIGGIQPDTGQPEVTALDFATGWEWITGEGWSWTNWSEFPELDPQPNQSGGEEDYLSIWGGGAPPLNIFIELGDWVDQGAGYLDPSAVAFLVEFPDGAIDLAGNTRIVDVPWLPLPGDKTVKVDMGAYEHQPDCNGNTLDDSLEVAEGTSPDCNSNGIIDACDIGFGFANDCDSNGILDSCEEGFNDCNANGNLDACDILGGTSLDLDANGQPDECARLYVDAAAMGNSNGMGWTDAYTSLQDALLDASTNTTITEIWVAAGRYTPDQGGNETTGDRSATFVLQNDLAIYGGFSGNETTLNQRDPDSNETILSGDLLGNDTLVACTTNSIDCDAFGGLCVDDECIIADNNGENSFHVVTGITSTDNSAVIDGLLIVSGNANGSSPDWYGGGLYNDTNSSPKIANCTFTANSANSSGGGMYNNRDSNPTVIYCTFSGNSAALGGGMNNRSVSSISSPTVINSTFTANSASSDGGGIHNEFSSPVVTNCTFTGNSAGSEGGGMHTRNNCSPTVTNSAFFRNSAASGGGMSNRDSSSTRVTNCTFTGNSAGEGGGMYNTSVSNPTVANSIFTGNTASSGGGIFNSSSSPTVTNCTLSGNLATNNGGGMNNLSNSSPTVINCILWGNLPTQFFDSVTAAPTVNHSIVQGSWNGAGGIGVIDADPGFVDADGADNMPGTLDDDLRLACCSPAVDAGSNGAVPSDSADLDSNGNTIEPTPLDLAGNPRFVDDPNAIDTGVGTPPIVDMGALEAPADGCGVVSDCNGNTVADACDISGGTSGDCDLNGVPDECQAALPVVSSVWVTTNGFWNTDINWCPAVVPDNDMDHAYDVLVDGAASLVTLDIDPVIDNMMMTNGAVVEVNATGGGHTLSVLNPIDNGIEPNGGIFRATDGQELRFDASTTILGGVLEATNSGIITLDGAIADDVSLRASVGGRILAENNGLLIDPTVELLEIVNGNYFFIEGRVDNRGVILVNAEDSLTRLRPTATLAEVRFVNDGIAPKVALAQNPAEPLSSAIVGDLSTTMVNSSGHTIEGVGKVVGTIVENLGVIRALDNGGDELEIFTDVTENSGLIEIDTNGMLRTSGIVRSTSVGSKFLMGPGSLMDRPDLFALVDGATYQSSVFTGLEDGMSTFDNLLITTGLDASGGSTMLLTGHMNVEVNGQTAVQDQPCDLRGCIRSRFEILDQAIFTTNSLYIDNEAGFYASNSSTTTVTSSLTISSSGTLTVEGDAQLSVDGDFEIFGPSGPTITSDQAVFVAGNFVNYSTQPSLFDWSGGTLTLNGATQQAFEVAGTDLFGVPLGFQNNFAIGHLEITSDADVLLESQFDNDAVRDGPCQEALYVDQLTLRNGAAIELDDVRLYYNQLADEGAMITTNGCGEMVAIVSGDYDGDGDIDLADYDAFAVCQAGPDAAYSNPQCCALDFDQDGDTDLNDAATFMRFFDAP